MQRGMVRIAAVLWTVTASGAFAQTSAQDSVPPPADLPFGVSKTLWSVSVKKGQEPTPEKVKLGEKLFLEPRLSANNAVSCSTCHLPDKGFVDGLATSVGVDPKQHTQRNSPTVLNAMFNASQFWDGRSATLEDQAKLPILNPIEMGMKSPEEVVAKVRAIPEYAEAFRKIYGRDVTYDDLANAIASFERTQFSGNAPFDEFIMGNSKALSDSAKRGWALFNGKARCSDCHAGNAANPLFSDGKFHNIGIAAHKQDFDQLAAEGLRVVQTGNEKQIDELAIQSKFTELGRFLVTKRQNDIGSFKTPTLRNIGITGPYMHDGSLTTLWDVMDHYNKGGVHNRFLDGGIQALGLTEKEIDDVVAFLFTLTDKKFDKFNKAELARQTKLKTKRPQRETEVAMGKKGHVGDIGVNPDLRNPAELGSFGLYPQPEAKR